MIKNETVFVLGAGASIPYKFPSGITLVKEIIKGAFDDRSVLSQMFPRSIREDFSKALDLSFAPSIDDFLEKRPEFMEIGKASISAHLIAKESPSNITRETEGNWYELLWQCMQAKNDEFTQNKVSFLTFNYDRSLEFFLQRALINYFGISKERANQILDEIPIIHVHGMLGAFKEEQPYYRDYNPQITKEIIEVSAKMIRVFHEKSQDADDIAEKANVLFNEASTICFLGFGYHPVNIQRIKVDKFNHQKHMVGSVYHLEQAERDRIPNLLSGIKLGFSSSDCLDFLRTNFMPT